MAETIVFVLVATAGFIIGVLALLSIKFALDFVEYGEFEGLVIFLSIWMMMSIFTISTILWFFLSTVVRVS